MQRGDVPSLKKGLGEKGQLSDLGKGRLGVRCKAKERTRQVVSENSTFCKSPVTADQHGKEGQTNRIHLPQPSHPQREPLFLLRRTRVGHARPLRRAHRDTGGSRVVRWQRGRRTICSRRARGQALRDGGFGSISRENEAGEDQHDLGQQPAECLYVASKADLQQTLSNASFTSS
jgi:hypothetical protein